MGMLYEYQAWDDPAEEDMTPERIALIEEHWRRVQALRRQCLSDEEVTAREPARPGRRP